MKLTTTHHLLITFIALFMLVPAMAQDTADKKSEEKAEEFDWNPVIDAIAWHESKGNARVVNGRYVGILQIAPVLVRECNNILKQRGLSKHYTLNDRLSPEKSKEMFRLIMSKYNPENDIDKACRIWKGGIHYKIRNTQPFVNWVHRYMKQHESDYQK